MGVTYVIVCVFGFFFFCSSLLPKMGKKGEKATKSKKRESQLESQQESQVIEDEETSQTQDQYEDTTVRPRSMTSPNVIQGGTIEIAQRKKSFLERLTGKSKKVEIKSAPKLPPPPDVDTLNNMFKKLLVCRFQPLFSFVPHFSKFMQELNIV